MTGPWWTHLDQCLFHLQCSRATLELTLSARAGSMRRRTIGPEDLDYVIHEVAVAATSVKLGAEELAGMDSTPEIQEEVREVEDLASGLREVARKRPPARDLLLAMIRGIRWGRAIETQLFALNRDPGPVLIH